MKEEQKMNRNEIAKLEFLKNYLDTQKNLEYEDAWNSLSEFYQSLPEKAKGKERKEYFSMLIEQMQLAFKNQIELIAKCPYIKIEIGNQAKVEDMQSVYDMVNYLSNNLKLMQGYIQCDADMTSQRLSKIETYLQNQDKSNKTFNFAEYMEKMREVEAYGKKENR